MKKQSAWLLAVLAALALAGCANQKAPAEAAIANAEPLLALVRQKVLQQPALRLVVLSLEESPDLDGTALETLGELCAWLAARGVELRVARLKERARHALLRARLTQLPPEALDYSSVDDAVRGEGVTPDDR